MLLVADHELLPMVLWIIAADQNHSEHHETHLLICQHHVRVHHATTSGVM